MTNVIGYIEIPPYLPIVITYYIKSTIMIGKLNDTQIEHVLQSQIIGHLACYANENLYLVPITYAYQQGYIYCQSKQGHKIDLMRKNPAVCFEVDQIENFRSWRSVIIWGEYERLEGDDEQVQARQILFDRISPFTTGETVVPEVRQDVPETFRIKIKKQTGRYEKTI